MNKAFLYLRNKSLPHLGRLQTVEKAQLLLDFFDGLKGQGDLSFFNAECRVQNAEWATDVSGIMKRYAAIFTATTL